jgi:hypothetical protein
LVGSFGSSKSGSARFHGLWGGIPALALEIVHLLRQGLGALQFLLSKGKMTDRGPDQSAACNWADGVLEALDPASPEVPY